VFPVRYRAGNRYIGHVVGVRVVGDTVQIALDGLLLRTHRARHDKLKEFGALNNPGGRPRRKGQDVAYVPEPFRGQGYRDLTVVVFRVMPDVPASPDPLQSSG
jgi:hypothetical protein